MLMLSNAIDEPDVLGTLSHVRAPVGQSLGVVWVAFSTH